MDSNSPASQPISDSPLDYLNQPISPPNPSHVPIITIEELLQTKEAALLLEEEDRTALRTVLTIDEAQLKKQLLLWVGAGFPNSYVLHTVQLTIPPVCSDGVSRDFLQYVSFLMPEFSISQVVLELEKRLPGMVLAYSYTNTYALRVHVSKK